MFTFSAQKLFRSSAFSLYHLTRSAIIYVHPLNYTILQRCLANCIVLLNTVLITKFQIFNISVHLVFYFCFPQYKFSNDFRLVLHEIYPNISRNIIKESNEKLKSTFRQLPHYSSNIKMHIIKNTFCILLSHFQLYSRQFSKYIELSEILFAWFYHFQHIPLVNLNHTMFSSMP